MHLECDRGSAPCWYIHRDTASGRWQRPAEPLFSIYPFPKQEHGMKVQPSPIFGNCHMTPKIYIYIIIRTMGGKKRGGGHLHSGTWSCIRFASVYFVYKFILKERETERLGSLGIENLGCVPSPHSRWTQISGDSCRQKKSFKLCSSCCPFFLL